MYLHCNPSVFAYMQVVVHTTFWCVAPSTTCIIEHGQIGSGRRFALLPRHWLWALQLEPRAAARTTTCILVLRHSGTLQRLTGQDRDFSEGDIKYWALRNESCIASAVLLMFYRNVNSPFDLTRRNLDTLYQRLICHKWVHSAGTGEEEPSKCFNYKSSDLSASQGVSPWSQSHFGFGN